MSYRSCIFFLSPPPQRSMLALERLLHLDLVGADHMATTCMQHLLHLYNRPTGAVQAKARKVSRIHVSGEAIVTLYTALNPFLLVKLCLNQSIHPEMSLEASVRTSVWTSLMHWVASKHTGSGAAQWLPREPSNIPRKILKVAMKWNY